MTNFKNIFKTVFIVAIVVILIDLIFGGMQFEQLGQAKLLGTFLFYSAGITISNVFYFAYFNKKIGWEAAHIKRVFMAAAGAVVVTMAAYFLCRLILIVVFQNGNLIQFLKEEELKFYLFPLLLATIISLIFHLIYFYKALQEKKVTEQKIIAGTASAKFESLKNQLDPHFLFNSLNVLSALIEENPVQAQQFTGGLSKIYRYVLEQKDKELVEVEEELAFAVTYMELLKMRFEDSIFYEIKALQTPQAKIVPLSLQLLLENTIKHNVVSDSRPLHIKIYEAENHLIIENNLQKKEVLLTRKGVGLQNIINRYALVTKRKVFIETDKTKFAVKLPMLTQQISIMQPTETNENQAYLNAKRRVKEIKDFYGNLLSYAVVIPVLIFINYQTYWGFQWFWFPLLGWGIGLSIHGFSVFGYGRDWEERKIKEIMQKEQQQSKIWK